MPKTFVSFLILFFTACNESANQKFSSEETLLTNSKAQILNGIIVHQSGGLEIYRAFLSYPNGTLLNGKNIVHVGDTICLNLLVKQGWMAEDGLVSIGAKQIISTENDEPILSSPDLFAGKPKMQQTTAAQLQLKATLTKVSPNNHAFLVQYHVWDKIGPGKVSGHYRLQLAVSNLE